MNKKIFALILVTSVNCATLLHAMDDGAAAAAASPATDARTILQEVFNTHALRLAPPPASEQSQGSFFFAKKDPQAEHQREISDALSIMKTTVEEAHKLGVALEVLKISDGEITVWPVHEAADAGHPFIGTVATLNPTALTERQIVFRVPDKQVFELRHDTPQGIVEKLAEKNPNDCMRLERLYEVHAALKKAGTLDPARSLALWTSIVAQLAQRAKDKPEETPKGFLIGSAIGGYACGSGSFKIGSGLALVTALEKAHTLGIRLGGQIPGEHQESIFTSAVRERNRGLVVAAKRHGMMPSQEIIASAQEKAKRPPVKWGTIETLAALLANPASEKDEI